MQRDQCSVTGDAATPCYTRRLAWTPVIGTPFRRRGPRSCAPSPAPIPTRDATPTTRWSGTTGVRSTPTSGSAGTATSADAQDLTQEFFARAFEKEYLEKYDPARARFRTFVRTCLDGFLANERQRPRRG